MLKRLSIKTIIGCWTALFSMALHADAARISVFVSIPPQRYFAQQIGKDHVSVQVMVHPGASPATYEPKSVQMAATAKTDVYFSIYATFTEALTQLDRELRRDLEGFENRINSRTP
ncbi:MAG: zinc ABC transporter substrate-binding protein [Desulfobacteraceae bacterium]|jgi:zinc transport system substrate-binding protein